MQFQRFDTPEQEGRNPVNVSHGVSSVEVGHCSQGEPNRHEEEPCNIRMEMNTHSGCDTSSRSDGSDDLNSDGFSSDNSDDEVGGSSDSVPKSGGSFTKGNEAHGSMEERLKEPSLGFMSDTVRVFAPVPSDLWEKEFATSEDAYDFYLKYARSVGFGVRRGDVVRNSRKEMISRSFFCCKEGFRLKKHYIRDNRKRAPKSETRTGCQARLVVHVDNSGSKWKVHKFVETHNHELIGAQNAHLIRSHRKISSGHQAQEETLQRHGMQTSQILGFMAGQCAGYRSLGFRKKDLYNHINKSRRAKIVDGDAASAISYLEGRADVDGMTIARYTITDDERLGSLFWSDDISRVDYQYFGDVLAIDLTHKKNKYTKPLVIFSGANNHDQTSVFGFGLLSDECIETYEWLLEHFLEVMGNKEPKVVVTDSDESMREAICRVFPRSTHRLCAWHLHKNALANIKNAQFCEAFRKCIYGKYTPQLFEEIWQKTIDKFGLVENKWVQSVYAKKEMWATSYLLDKFCVGIRTTSRCEGIDSYIRRFIRSQYSLLELVQSLERVVKAYRNNELESQFESINTFPVYDTGMHSIEVAAAKVYTKAVFLDVKEQMLNVSSLVIVGIERFSTTTKYQVCKFGKPNRVFDVLYDRIGDENGPKLECECSLWNMNGIPCSHVFLVMRNEHIAELPDRLVLKRWRKDAKTYDRRTESDDRIDAKRREIMRLGALNSASLWMSFLASKSEAFFNKAFDAVLGMTHEFDGNGKVGSHDENRNLCSDLGDPVVARTTGAPRLKKGESRKRLCPNCGLSGHTKRKCTTAYDEDHEDSDGCDVQGKEADGTVRGPSLATEVSASTDHTNQSSNPVNSSQCLPTPV